MGWCTQCGSRLGDGDAPCARCEGVAAAGDVTGVHVGLLSELGDVTLSVESSDLPVLVAVRGPNAGSRWHLPEGSSSIGRVQANTILLDDISVSRRHAHITREGRQVEVIDLGSLNGTYVNRRRIEGECDLRTGDQLQVGRFHLVFLG